MIADGSTYAADPEHSLLQVDRVATLASRDKVIEHRGLACDRIPGRRTHTVFVQQFKRCAVVERGEKGLAEARAVDCPPGSQRCVGTDARFRISAYELVNADEFAAIAHGDECGFMRLLRQALHISMGDRPEVELIADTQPKFYQAHPKPQALSFLPDAVQVSPEEECLNQPVCAAPRYLQPVADL